jgi:sigma-54 dependent transcriptional regulator, acetoin dehydrogenase operon transcriptional activator AcoR
MGGKQQNAEQKPGPAIKTMSHRGTLSEHSRRTMAAWEQFVSGNNEVQGVSSSVLLSWYRCRDLYRVDPNQASAPRAGTQGPSALVQNSVFAQLGGIAASLVDRDSDCLSTVTDGDGRILAAWGAGRTMHKAEDSHLAPFFAWSEAAIGTNGMGTALRQARPVTVRGPEHWCAALHDWYCTGVAIYDSVTHEPVAALNVSSWEHDAPVDPRSLTEKTEVIRQELRNRALRNATAVTLEFIKAERHAHGAVFAVDIAGGVLAANEKAQAFLNGFPDTRLLEVTGDREETPFELREIAKKSTNRARSEPQWVGAADLGFLLGKRTSRVFTITPIHAAGDTIGLLLTDDADADAERIDEEVDGPEVAVAPKRIPAVHADRILLLAPEEIRYAEASRHDVWLVTDRGRVRAATHGIDNVERELTPLGFMRVHRSYVVNLGRIREISERGNGALTLSTDPQRQEAIAVSRRCAFKLRRHLGF